MNKKLFTLAAGLLLGTAFTVNAQDDALKKGAEVDGNTYYYKGIKINDLNPLNVLKTPNEGYAVIDAELRFTGIMQEDYIGNSVKTFTT